MNTDTGEVIKLLPDQKPPSEKWVPFGIGEVIEIKGAKFRITNVKRNRLFLKLVKGSGA